MKKNWILVLCTTACAAVCSVSLAACEKHTHSYTEEITAPTCTEQGYTTHTCSCGHNYVDTYVKALGHKFVTYTSNNNATLEQNCTETSICAYDGCNETHTREIAGTMLDAGLYFTVNGGMITGLTAYAKENCPELTIPSKINGVKITSIKESAFSGCSNLTSITIPNGVTSIGDWAFSGCSSLTSVVIGNGVASIKGNTFVGCSSLANITLPDSVTRIGTTRDYGNSAFYNTAYYNDQNNWEEGGLYIGKHLITVNKATTGAFTIKEGTLTIADIAFMSCSSLTSITIPDSVTSIGNSAFYYCSSLTSVVIPDSVTSIGNSAFYYCSNLTSVVIGNGVASIKGNTFVGCSSLANITLPDSVTSIGEYAFRGCSNLTSITIPDSVTSIGEYAFYYCSNLTSVVIPDSVTSIGNSAFYYCSSLTIYCEVASKPSGWSSWWNDSDRPVYWYRENQPTTMGNYWHYGENSEIVVW